MSMSTTITGYRNPDSREHQAHLKVLEACREGEISLPHETALYFDSQTPVNVDPDEVLEVNISFHKVHPHDMAEGYEVVLSELPPGVNKIRFTNSW